MTEWLTDEQLDDLMGYFKGNAVPVCTQVGRIKWLIDQAKEANRLRKLNEWQPIESAPKDGRCILTYDSSLVDRELDPPERGMKVNRVQQGWPNGEIVWNDYCRPTHWQYLPEPPKEEN